ncbi:MULTISPECIES: cytochrome P450 [unclassified Novosphingobium]|uniref:cytochrome P450 n=1 Tax=unclassified Novosphingobium TaxID=2644732 RepID=UPI000D473346|nr:MULTISPECIES: cytochrome P450 [unclassified Novosphingobium]PTR12580.1 cytochrome P450 [Novosphingobium sp. GV055]PUB06364.1 cytochrome P450 [Novosphingobium sp. GV061]PUB22415.1 cytochrome P450 [Novosphingobium sp. GV079]PUB44440.1 cytochrome P450 [Novosphingobium sp. GV027]
MIAAGTSNALDEFDIHQPDARLGAEYAWQRMRDMPGLYHNGRYGGFYVAARYEDVMTVLMNPKIFGSSKGITLPPPDAVRSYHIPAEVDPPAHGEYRALMMQFTTVEAARQREPFVRKMAAGLLDGIPLGETVDFVRVFARPLPILVALDLLRLPASDAPDLEQLVGDLHREVATGVVTGAGARLKSYAESVLERRRSEALTGDEDLVASILHGQVFGRSLTDEEQMSMVRLILVGGFDTTSSALASMMYWLAMNPAEVERLRSDPKLIDTAGEEIVRLISPSTYLRREVMGDTVLGGTSLKRGDSVLVAYGAANHDPRKFECPEAVVADRKPNPHVGFGAGRHRCIGSFIAKTQLRLAVEEILARFTSFRVGDPAEIQYTTGLGQGISSLPMVFAR